jgi:Arc/MetJ-type ribon-helix-helix transcriptional regulator
MLADKISITLPQHLNQFASDYQAKHHLKSKSEVIALSLKMLEAQHLEACYRDMESALAKKTSQNELKLWEPLLGEGLDHEDW